MADTKIVGGKGVARESGKGHDHEHGCGCHVDHKTIGGKGTKHHPFEVIGLPGAQAFALTTTTIYVRPNGSDKHGDGKTPATAFQTFQHAVNTVSLLPTPGARFVIDITGIGTEVLPFGYCLPKITFPVLAYENDTEVPYFYSGAGLRIRALPQLASSIPPAEAVIDGAAGAVVSVDPDTNLITLTIASGRSSWTPGNLVGKQLIRTVGSYFANCVIADVPDDQTLVLTNDADSFNGAAQGGPGAGPLFLQPGEVVQIVEPSATLQTDPGDLPIDILGDNFAGMTSAVNSIAFQGIKFTQPGGGFPLALGVLSSPEVPLELCDIEGVFSQGTAGQYWTYANGSVIRGNLLAVNSSFFTQNCLITGITLFYFANATPQSFTNTIFLGCASLANGTAGLPILTNFALLNCLLKDSVAGFSTSPTGDGLYQLEGRVQMENVKIEGATGNGLRIEGAGSRADLVHVTGVVLGDYGIYADFGAQVSVDATTTVTGTLGAIKSGSLAPLTYANVAIGVNGGYDIPPNAPITDATGTRVYEK